ncbi:type VI secretion system-associated protein TagF [uncultured Deefgea sp.]|uniref:type VI secretion system-associated protein TagF n=1 Tax=uncultured Deefgea sp. TaxID=1304914 RepID=UPI0026062B01|nr:type VI secretion system-associated protein TagF [uncultured Deefgea sp.]
MAINLKRVQELQLQYAIFGKLPRRADFIRINATHPSAMKVDQLFADSMKYISHCDQWQDTYTNAPSSEFLFHSEDLRGGFLGVVLPSYDEARRYYPLLAGICIPHDVLNGNEAEFVLANELFFSGLKDQLKSAADNSVEMLACRQFMEDQLVFGHRAIADLELASQLLERHMRTTSAAQLEQALTDSQCGDLESNLLAFAFYFQLVRRYGASMTSQIFLLPLPAGAGEEILGASVWLSLCRAAIHSQGVYPLHFAFISQDGMRYLALAFNPFSEAQLSMLWGQTPDERQLVRANDLQSPWRSHQSYAEASYVLGRQLCDPSLSLLKLREIVLKVTHGIC